MDYIIITLIFVPFLMSFLALMVALKTRKTLISIIGDSTLEKWLGTGRKIEDLQMRQADMVERFNRFQQRESINNNRSKRASEKELVEEAKKILDENTQSGTIVDDEAADEKASLRKKVFGG